MRAVFNKTSLKFVVQFVLILLASFIVISTVAYYTGADGQQLEESTLLPNSEARR